MLRRLVTLAILAETSLCFAQVTANQTGINVDFLHDSDNTPMLTDVMRTYRDVNAIGSSYNANNGAVDANGWPTQDAWYFLGDANFIANGSGTYALKFTGQANVSFGTGINALTGSSNVTTTYDPTTNTSTALINVTGTSALTQLQFTNTQRSATSATNTGITDIQLMRPTSAGSTTPYSFDSTFTNQTLTIASKTNVLRFMDYLATNSSTQVNWSDRVTPGQVQLDPSTNHAGDNSRGQGGPLELAVALGNSSNKDIWINIPAQATNDYITKVADLIKYGSDGVNPYTSVQANPVYKPLDSNLHVYVEYSNETWNTAVPYQQNAQILALAKAEVASYGSNKGALNFDATATNPISNTQLIARYTAEHLKDIAGIFAGVYGQSAMLTTVRPILAWQAGNGSDTANQASKVLEGYYDNLAGKFVSNPTPINSYVYGGGGDDYYYPTDTSSVSSILSSSVQANNATLITNSVKDIAYTTTFGIKRVAYEGGLSLATGTTTQALEATKIAALANSGMEQLVVKNHNSWTDQGGTLLVYYYSTDQTAYAMSDSNFSTTTPKLNALTDLQSTAADTNYTVGTAILRTQKTVIQGGRFTINDTEDTPYGSSDGTSFSPLNMNHAGAWSTYLINIPNAGNFSLGMDYQFYTPGGSISVYLGGALLYSTTNAPVTGKYIAMPEQLLSLAQGITSVRVLIGNTSPGGSLEDISFTPQPTIQPIPEPAMLSTLLLGGTALLRRKRRL